MPLPFLTPRQSRLILDQAIATLESNTATFQIAISEIVPRLQLRRRPNRHPVAKIFRRSLSPTYRRKSDVQPR